MKQLSSCIAVLALSIGLLSCSNTAEQAEVSFAARLTATTEEDAGTRASLSTGSGVSRVLWSEDDQIAVFIDGNTKPDIFSLESGAGSKQATFKGGASGASYYAFYPLSMIPSVSGNTIRVTLPAKQQYTEGSFAPDAFPMAAASMSEDLQFRNLCSVLRISMTGHNTVTRIVFRPTTPDIKVCGKSAVYMDDTEAPVLIPTEQGVDSLVMTVPDVVLDEATPTHFYMVLPSQTYKGGFSVRVYSGKRYMDKDYTSDFTMARSRLHKAKTFVFKPEGLDESQFLSGNGTEDDPFLIQSLPDLILMRDAVNADRNIATEGGTAREARTAHYKLTCDLDLSAVCGKESGKVWKPIGTFSSAFSGTFNGGSHKIDNLYISALSSSYQGLFGCLDYPAKLSSLSVCGEVAGYSYCGLIAGRGSGSEFVSCSAEGQVSSKGSYCGGIVGYVYSISNSISKAEVKGVDYAGGLAGYSDVLRDCMNKGNVSGQSNTGGLAGCAGSQVTNCVNYGTVCGFTYVGGICGYGNYGQIVNCMNEASVSGSERVGGIVGFAFQRTGIMNCVNHSGVTCASDYAGGICGFLGSQYATNGSTTILNCVNCGSIVSSSAYTGGICGFVEGAVENFQTSAVEQSYWLWDSGKQLGIQNGIGVNQGKAENNRSLTEKQMKGATYSTALYKSYKVVTDALSSWAFDNRYNSWSSLMQGWKYASADSWPVLSGFDATEPGSGESVLTVDPGWVQFNALSHTLEVAVLSSLDYTFTLPKWITAGDVVQYETKPNAKYHIFLIGANSSSSTRNGEIRFTNTAGKMTSVWVYQEGKYLDLGESSIVLSDTGGSKTVAVSSSLEWTASSNESWCSVSPKAGKGSGDIVVSAAANESETARGAVITVKSTDGSVSRTLNVAQSGKPSGDQMDWTTREFVHKSIVMRFTATWCGWCPRMNKTILRAQEMYPDKITYLAIHGGGSDLYWNQSDDLMAQYGVRGFPTGLVDCRTTISNGEIEATATKVVNAVKETESTYGTLTGIAISSSWDGENIKADINVYAKKAGTYKLMVLVVEDGIINPQDDYEEGYHSSYTHNCVVRSGSAISSEFEVAKDNMVQHSSYFTNVPSVCKKDKLRLVAYVQRKFGSDPVIQSSSSFGEYFVDNSVDVKVGESIGVALVGGTGSGAGDGGDNEGIGSGGGLEME